MDVDVAKNGLSSLSKSTAKSTPVRKYNKNVRISADAKYAHTHMSPLRN